jgi:hypothetical protein
MSVFTLDITAFVEQCKAALLNGEPTPVEHKDKENLGNKMRRSRERKLSS